MRLLTSTDGVTPPPNGAPLTKFSFSSPEPSVDSAGLVFEPMFGTNIANLLWLRRSVERQAGRMDAAVIVRTNAAA